MHYNAFISYSHAADDQLAPAIQRGLQQLAKPWNRRRALSVFRDKTGLAVNPHLWGSIVTALDASEWFVVLASPEAAASPWVNREIEHFLATRPDGHDRLLPVVTGGVWAWDEAAGAFSATSTCVPPALAAAFTSEPLHLELSWARHEDHLHLRRADFRSAIADIAAPIHGIPKDELESEDIRTFRRERRLRRSAVSVLAMLALGLGVASVVAIRAAANARVQEQLAADRARDAEIAQADAQREAARAVAAETEAESEALRALAEAERAENNSLTARSNELAARSTSALSTQPELAALLAVEALYPDGVSRERATAEAVNAVGAALRRLDEADAVRLPGELTGFTSIETARDAGVLAVIEGDQVELVSARDERLFDPLGHDDAVIRGFEIPGLVRLFVSSDASRLVATVDEPLGPRVIGIDVATDTRTELGLGEAVAVSPNGELAAIAFADDAAFPPTTGSLLIVATDDSEIISQIDLRPAGTNWQATVASASFSPDNSRLAWVQGLPRVFDVVFLNDDDELVRIHTIRSGQDDVEFPIQYPPESLHWSGDGSISMLYADGRLAQHDASGQHMYDQPIDVFVPGLGGSDPRTFWFDPSIDRIVTIDEEGRLRVGAWSERSRPTVPSAFSDLVWVDDEIVIVADESGRAVRYRPHIDQIPVAIPDPTGVVDYVDQIAVRRADGTPLWEYDGQILAIDPRGATVAEFVGDVVVIRDARTGERRSSWTLPADLADEYPEERSIQFSPSVYFVNQATELVVSGRRLAVVDGTAAGELGTDAILAWSPDGTSYITQSYDLDGTARTVLRDLASGAAVDAPFPPRMRSASWLPDGGIIVGTDTGSVGIVRPEEGTSSTILSRRDQVVTSVTPSADGERILVTTGGGEFLAGENFVMTTSGEIIDLIAGLTPAPPNASSLVDNSGFWVGWPGSWQLLSDLDPASACAAAIRTAEESFVELIGEPSVCLTLPELAG